jgi:sugar lactone lactonase YvrE
MLATSGRSLSGQSEAAAAARAYHAQSVTAYQRKDYVRARDLMAKAREAWPGQSAYVIGLASLYARVRDTAATAHWLNYYADLGLGLDLSRDDDIAVVGDAPIVKAALARVAANLAPIARSRIAFRLPEADFFPEGMTLDEQTGTFYVASVRHRKIARVGPAGDAADFVPEGRYGLLAVLGLRADPARGLLWATSAAVPQMLGYQPADSGRSGLFAFDLKTGALRHRLWLPDIAGGHLLGDLLVTPEGEVYATDSKYPAIYRVRAGADSVEEFLMSTRFRSLQGLVLSRDRKRLLVADYSLGLFAIDRASRVIRWLPAPEGTTVFGIDGMAADGADVIAIQNGVNPARVVRLGFDAAVERVTRVEVLDRHLPEAEEPTIGTLSGRDFYYVANSQWHLYDENDSLPAGTAFTAPVVLRLPLH